MPKFPNYPTLYDDVLQISVTKLKEWGYLKPDNVQSGTISWSRNDHHRASISIRSNTYTEHPYIQLDYNFNDKPISYKIELVSVPSNLGKGLIWYFLCPNTYKQCRKLYQIGGYFLHREAFKGCFYESQVHSKYFRNMDKTLGAFFNTDKLYSELYSKHFTKYYNGKPTKRYLKLKKQIKQAESIPFSEIQKLTNF